MATTQTITPSLGNAPSFLQGGVGSSTGYGAIDFRRFFFGAPVQEGVIDAGSFEVTERAAGANMTVDIAASTGNGALVQGDAVTSQGPYYVPPHSAPASLDIATADATNPRVDTIWLEIEDDTHDAGGSNLARLRVISGTATGGATLDNRTGAASNPGSAILLADVLVPATATTISNSQIRCRRPWARGIYYSHTRTAGNITTTATSATDVDTAIGSGSAFNVRLECSGKPLQVMLLGQVAHSVDGAGAVLTLRQDTAGTFADVARRINNVSGAAGQLSAVPFAYEFTPSAGSFRFKLQVHGGAAGTTTIFADSTTPVSFVIQEVVRQDTLNNINTSG